MDTSPETIITKTCEVYDHIASQFSNTRSFVWADLRPLAAFVRSGDCVLDIGCGNGRLLQLFKEKEIFYMGIDQSAELLDIARKKFPDTEFVHGDMRQLPFSDSTVNIIFSIAAFHHLPDETMRLQALDEMKRVVKSGGRIVMTNWNLLGDWAVRKLGNKEIRKLRGDVGDFMVPWKNSKGVVLGERYYHAFTQIELEALFKKVGLMLEEQYYVKKGERSDAQHGENIISISKSP